jgi:hypothetical protein
LNKQINTAKKILIILNIYLYYWEWKILMVIEKILINNNLIINALIMHTTTCLHWIMDKYIGLVDSQPNYHITMKYILLFFPSFNHCERYAHWDGHI